MSAQRSAGRPLLVVIDPAARAIDGESVRIAKDVLCAGMSSVKIALPDSPEEVDRALAHRGRRQPVMIGDDRTLLRAVHALHSARALEGATVSLVPVGPRCELAASLGVPVGVLSAARAVLNGTDRGMDLLVDDSDGVVLDFLRIVCGGAPPAPEHWWVPLVRPLKAAPNGHAPPDRLRVEADGVVVVDLGHPVREVTVRVCAQGLAEVSVRRPDGSRTRVPARSVTVSGRDFHYLADTVSAGPVRRRTWTVRPGAWRLTVPR